MALWCFLAFFSSTSCLVAGQSTIYVLKGLGVNLTTGITRSPEYILWTHNGLKVVEFNGQEEHVYDPFKNRSTLNWHTAELSITNLGFQDNGDYELEAYVNSALYKSEFNLEVIDAVAKPNISCEMTDGSSSSNMSATLVCAAEPRTPQSLIKFEWSLNGNTQSRLTIPLGEKNDDKVYTCTVSNPLSAEEASFTAKDCLSDCSSVASIIIPIILVITLVLVILGIIYCKRYKKACFKTDEEKQTVSGATKGSAEETTPLVNNTSTSSNQQQHPGGGNLMSNEAASSHKGHTDSDPNSAEVDEMNLEDERPQKGFVKRLREAFESPGTKQSPGKKWLKGKSQDKPKETASPSSSQQSEQTSSSDQKKLVGGEEGDLDANQTGKEEIEIPQGVKEPDQAKALTTSGEDDQETSTSPEQPGVDIIPPELNSERSLEKNKDSGSEPEKPVPPLPDQNNLLSGDKGDSDADRLVKQEAEVSQSDSEAAQPCAPSSGQDTECNVETSSLPDQPGKSQDKPKETASPSSSQQSEQTSSSDQKKLVGGEEGDLDANQTGKEEIEIPQGVKEPD